MYISFFLSSAGHISLQISRITKVTYEITILNNSGYSKCNLHNLFSSTD